MSDELKILPCPACEGEAVYKESEGRMFVECQSCGMRGPSLSLNWKNVQETDAMTSVIAQWNLLPRLSDIEQAERERDWLAGIHAELQRLRPHGEQRAFLAADGLPDAEPAQGASTWAHVLLPR